MDLKHDKIIQDYIGQVCSQVRFRDVHQDIRLELEAHIQEIAEEYLTQGLSKEEAVTKAIAQMGSADVIGKELNKVHKPKPAWSVLILSFLFINIGLLAMFFIQKQGLLIYDSQLFKKSLLFSFMGLIPLVGLYFFDYRKLERYSKHIYGGTLIILIYTILWGIQVSGSRCWLTLGPFNVNFVAVSPLLLVVALAGIFNKWDWGNPLKLVQGLALLAGPLILFLAASSMSTGVIYVTACMVLMIVSGARLKETLLISGAFLAFLFLPILTAPYRLKRLVTFLNPESDPSGGGWLNLQLSKVISDSGLWGQGFTFEPKILPELHTDFIFAFITYTFGWVASILLITFVVMFLIRIVYIAKKIKINYGKLLISGFVSILTVQFLWNILMNLGLAPISGVGLPFISYGGSQLIVNAVIVGIISSIYRRKSISQSHKLS